MKTPVTTALPAVRPAAPRASDPGGAHSAAPFATALDGALSESRASDRGADRRSTPEDRATRADERAAAKDQRIDDRGRAAEQRAADKAARAEARESRATERTTRGTPASEADDAGRPVDETPGEVAPETDDETPDEAGRSAEAPRGGLPALWALLMGRSLATAPAEDASPEAGAPGPLPGVPAVDAAATAGAPVATQTIGGTSPADATGIPAAPTTAPATAGVPVAGTVATPAAPTAEGLPAGFSAVLADAGAVVTASGTPGATAPATTAAPAPVAALPVDLVLDAATPTGVPAATEAPTVVPSPAPVVADGGGETATGTADAAVAPAGGTPGEALSADAGGAGRPGADDAPPAPATSSQTTVGQATSVAPSATAAVADVDGATGTAATLPVGSQVARQVAVLSGAPDGDHSMTLVLTPDTLGEVQVQVTLSKGSIELALRGAHEHGRAALLDALPELRRELEAAGLNPSRVEVSRDTGGSWLDRQPNAQQGFGERGGSHDRGDNRSRPWGRPADIAGSGPSLNPNRSTSSGVDVRV